MIRLVRFGICCLFVGMLALALPVVANEDPTDPPVDFAREILPILSNKCFVCHGPAGTEKEVLRLDSYEEASRDLGGYRAIDAASPERSALLVRVSSQQDPMPPRDAEKQLTDLERARLGRWIRQGGQYAKHWAFVPPRERPPASDPAAEGQVRIDAYVLDKLQQQGASFAPEADRATLARRVALVLTGLPPEPVQLSAFLADDSKGAYERLVDELLASPRYGEHQARYWLDAVRYGDTHGLHLDNRRGIYPYRDWVVYALNQNLPLDDFITWQLAGDLLPDPALPQRVATGFVRMNPTTSEGGVIPAEFQAKNNFDRVETLGTVLLGMTLTCARCHSHKYDPIPQTEYYRLLAFFNSTAEHSLDGNSYTYKPVIQAPEDQEAWHAWCALEAQAEQLLAVVDKALPTEEQWSAILAHADAAAAAEDSPWKVLAEARQWEACSKKERLLMLSDAEGPLAPLNLQQQAGAIAQRMTEQEASFTTTLVAEDLPEPRETFLLGRGEYNLPEGEPLRPGILKVMGSFPAGAPRSRLGLARWLTSPEHPLTARVLINRVWQRTFGHGLVRTPEDFGLQGEHPTHPELLDWLALELRSSGWDLKYMLRLMVTSRTFRQSSARRTDLVDPENRLLARGPAHRLDAEVIRDLALWASDMLDPHMGGEGVKPYQPDGMWFALAHPASNTKRYVRDKGQRLYRRSLYVYWKRTSPHPMMTLFDAPDRESSCVRRSRTSTSLQSLGLLNETQRVEMARRLAQRLLREHPRDDARLDRLFTLLACRKPEEAERAACLQLLQKMRIRYRDAEQDALALLSMGDAPGDETLAPSEHAAWTQLAATVLASDVALLLY